MSDEQNGPSENGANPDLGVENLLSRARAALVIDGEASEIPDPEFLPATAAEAPPPEEPTPETPTPAGPVKRKKASRLWPVIATVVICTLGVAGYFGWGQWPSEETLATKMAPFVAWIAPSVDHWHAVLARAIAVSPTEAPEPTETVKAVNEPVKTPVVESAADKAVAQVTARLAVTQAALEQITDRLQALEAKPLEARPVEARTIVAPPEGDSASAEQATEKAVAEVTARLAVTQAALEQVTERLQVVEAKPAEAKPAEARNVDASAPDPSAEQAVAEMTSRLAATQAALAQVTDRLQLVEGQLTAPKTDSRALLAEREVDSANGGSVSARIVASQSLLSAIRQGDDYAPILTVLQNLGADPDRIARLRAGLTAPGSSALAKDFVALAPKILAATAPPAPQPPQAKEPQNLAETVIFYLETHAEKLVRIRPDSAANSENAARVARIEKNLTLGDLDAALAERAQLPAPALALTADWAAGAQSRLDAEQAAKAELDAALQSLSKNKS